MVEIEVIKPIGKHPAGAKLKIETDRNGVPVDKFWRKRFRESKLDGCIKVVEQPPTPKSKKRSTNVNPEENIHGDSNS